MTDCPTDATFQFFGIVHAVRFLVGLADFFEDVACGCACPASCVSLYAFCCVQDRFLGLNGIACTVRPANLRASEVWCFEEEAMGVTRSYGECNVCSAIHGRKTC